MHQYFIPFSWNFGFSQSFSRKMILRHFHERPEDYKDQWRSWNLPNKPFSEQRSSRNVENSLTHSYFSFQKRQISLITCKLPLWLTLSSIGLPINNIFHIKFTIWYIHHPKIRSHTKCYIHDVKIILTSKMSIQLLLSGINGIRSTKLSKFWAYDIRHSRPFVAPSFFYPDRRIGRIRPLKNFELFWYSRSFLKHT